MAKLAAVFNLKWGRPALLGLAVGVMLLATVIAVTEVRQEEPVTLQILPWGDPTRIRVYVGGAVHEPGIYDLRAAAGSLRQSPLLVEQQTLAIPLHSGWRP